MFFVYTRQMFFFFIFANVNPWGIVTSLCPWRNTPRLLQFITVGFTKLIFTSLIRISALNPISRYYVKLAAPRNFPVRRAKALI